jgi:hypothetical protein
MGRLGRYNAMNGNSYSNVTEEHIFSKFSPEDSGNVFLRNVEPNYKSTQRYYTEDQRKCSRSRVSKRLY